MTEYTPETLRAMAHYPSCRVSQLPYGYAYHSSRPDCTCGLGAHADAWEAEHDLLLIAAQYVPVYQPHMQGAVEDECRRVVAWLAAQEDSDE